MPYSAVKMSMQALGVMSQYFSLIMPNFRLKVTELSKRRGFGHSPAASHEHAHIEFSF